MKKILESKVTSNILALLTVVIMLILPFLQTWIQNTSPGIENNNNTFIIIAIVIAVVNIIILLFSAIRSKKENTLKIIDKLSILQNSYILSPNYVTSEQHSRDSQEEHLEKGGTAEILTNSLKYDIFYSSSIARNIINGARYIYFLPNSSIVLDDLASYITTIKRSITELLAKQGLFTETAESLLEGNLEFWFFDADIPCLYNFASFRQLSDGQIDHFTQDWWYINPPDTLPNSHMLSHEITDPRDQRDLDGIFHTLRKIAVLIKGSEVLRNRKTLNSLVGVKKA